MKFIDLTTMDKNNENRMKAAISAASVILLCVLGMIGISALLDAQVKADKEKRNIEASAMASEASSAMESSSEEKTVTSASSSDPSSSEGTSDTSDPSAASSDTSGTSAGTSESSSGTSAVTSDTSSETDATTTTDDTTATTATSETTTEATSETTTEATTTAVTEEVYYAAVYAAQSLNVRSGPGVEYDIVKTLNYGDTIDVVGRTSNGWYRTYNGNYVKADLTSNEPLIVTPTPTPSPKPSETTASTTQETTVATTTAEVTTEATTTTTEATTTTTEFTETSSEQNIDGMTYYGSCKITFYGPQPMGDGTYSMSTATGTTCTQGRTVAADWGVFPAGTVIYIPNDPLGGDGYYTVEDRGSAVVGNHIDIYADAGESFSTTSAEVYIVN